MLTTSAQERRTGDHATVGDALIFVTKAAFALIALITITLAVMGVLVTWTDAEQKLSAAHAQILTHEDTIAELGEKLNQCLVKASGGVLPMPPEGFVIEPKPWERYQSRPATPSGAELNAVVKPSERDWLAPPEDLVVDEPNPVEAELRRREDSSAAGER